MRMHWLIVPLIAVTAAVSCSKAPVEPSGAVTVTTPSLASPANGASIPNGSQPVTLTVDNAFVTGAGDEVVYQFQVASSTDFTTALISKDVPQGTGKTSAVLDVLQPGRDYFWRVRTKSEDTLGVFSAPLQFKVGASVTLQAPVPVTPEANDFVDPSGTFTVTNAPRTGPADKITYKFEISTSAAFGTTVATGTVAEGNERTSFVPSQGLPQETNLFWRAQALDAVNGVVGPFSAARAFRTTVTIDLRTVDYQRFVDPSGWAETSRIIEVDQDGIEGYMCVRHTKLGIWPPAPFLGQEDVHTEGTQWYFARINGRWYGGAGEWVRPNQVCKEGQTSGEIGPDGSWGGPMTTWRPKRGELVGYMMSTPARTWPAGRTLDERSNVVVVPWKEGGISTPEGAR